MGIENERPTNEELKDLPDRHFKKSISMDDIDDYCILREMHHSTLGYVATLGWIGEELVSGNKVRQPAILIDRNREETEEYYISYEGYANYMDYQITQSHLVVPRNGVVLKMKEGVYYFFNSHDSISPNLNYSLDSNNASIIMNNISIYNKAK